MPFRARLIKLHDTLKEWKPKTVWEMRHRGYGGVNPIGLYGFYFSIVVGMIAIVALSLTAVQVYAVVKSLDNVKMSKVTTVANLYTLDFS